MNIGHSSRLPYDTCFYPDNLTESVAPGDYRLQQYSTYNCDSCLAPFGVKLDIRGNGVSTSETVGPAMSQRLVDVESNLSNRGLPQSRCRSGRVNLTDVEKQKLNHRENCTNGLSPEYSHYTSSPKNFRDAQINRFYNLKKNPQEPIFYDFAVNTTLEAKDNFKPQVPKFFDNKPYPVEECRKEPYTLECLARPKKDF
jgi:hypothetical protein